MGDHIPFRTSLFGFHREDVIQYIERLQAAMAENSGSREQTDRDIAGRDQEIIALKAENDRLSSRLAQAEQDLARRETECGEITRRAEAERAQLEQTYRRQLEERADRASDSEEKLKSIQAQVGALMLDAQVYADQIVAHAEERVTSLTNEYKETARSVSDDITTFTAELSDTTEALNRSLGTLKERLTSISDKLELATPSLFDGDHPFPKFTEEYARRHHAVPADAAAGAEGTTQFEINLDNLEISAVHSHKKGEA